MHTAGIYTGKTYKRYTHQYIHMDKAACYGYLPRTTTVAHALVPHAKERQIDSPVILNQWHKIEGKDRGAVWTLRAVAGYQQQRSQALSASMKVWESHLIWLAKRLSILSNEGNYAYPGGDSWHHARSILLGEGTGSLRHEHGDQTWHSAWSGQARVEPQTDLRALSALQHLTSNPDRFNMVLLNWTMLTQWRERERCTLRVDGRVHTHL